MSRQMIGKEATTWQEITAWVSGTWSRDGPVMLMYVSSALGALSKSFFDAAVAGNEFSMSTGKVLFAFVVSAVTFPVIFEAIKRAQKSVEKPTLLTYFTAYQNGFFWQTLLTQIM